MLPHPSEVLAVESLPLPRHDGQMLEKARKLQEGQAENRKRGLVLQEKRIKNEFFLRDNFVGSC